jgi:hypothetical protein
MGLLNVYADRLRNESTGGVASVHTANGVQLSAGQFSALRTAYQKFSLAGSNSIVGYRERTLKLSDGTVVRMVSNNGKDSIMAWPPTGEPLAALLHGFGVKDSWCDPQFYLKTDGTWGATYGPCEQILDGRVTYNHLVRDSTGGSGAPDVFAPFVYGRDAELLWDFAPHGGFELTAEDATLPDPGAGASENTFVPLCLAYTAEGAPTATWEPHSLHYAVDDAVLAADGTRLWTMAETAALGVAANPLRKLPACTDAAGTRVALQQWRYMISSPTFEIYHFRFAHDLLKRVDDSDYELVERQDTFFSSQALLAAPSGTSGASSATFSTPELQYIASLSGAGAFATDPVTSFWFKFDVVMDARDMTDKITSSSTGGWSRSAASGGTPSTVADVLPLPEAAQISTLTMLNGLAYPEDTYYEASNVTVGLVPWDTSGVGPTGGTEVRREVQRNMDADPSFAFDLGWKQFDILEGVVVAACFGEDSYRDETFKNSYTGDEYTDPNQAWLPSGYSLPSFTNPTEGYAAYLAGIANRIPFHVWAVTMPNATVRVSETQVPFACSGSFTYKSRYILDYDHRARFIAALRVEVQSAGASWTQAPAGYTGQLTQTGTQTVTISLYVEITTSAGTYSQLLVQESSAMPVVGWQLINPSNVLIWPTPDTDKPLYIYAPPHLQPGYGAYMQLENVARHQGVNPHLAASDYLTGLDAGTDSEQELEPSHYDGATEYPHPRRPEGILYARSFTLAAFAETALWMLTKLQLDVPQNLSYLSPDTALWHYFPDVGAAINSSDAVHVEFRDNAFVNWSDDIPEAEGETRPALKDRALEVYYV